jgi:hypothetical protein
MEYKCYFKNNKTFEFASNIINVSTDAAYSSKVLRFSALWKKEQNISHFQHEV